jgi:hypothetical protein
MLEKGLGRERKIGTFCLAVRLDVERAKLYGAKRKCTLFTAHEVDRFFPADNLK